MRSAAFLPLLLAGCHAPPHTDCGTMPADFIGPADPRWTQRPGIPIEPPRFRVIHLTAGGRVFVGGVELVGSASGSQKKALDSFVAMVAQLTPMPPVTLVFDRRTSCSTIDTTQRIMRRHLECTPTSLTCFQGPPERGADNGRSGS